LAWTDTETNADIETNVGLLGAYERLLRLDAAELCSDLPGEERVW
jgi:hypothetical protein